MSRAVVVALIALALLSAVVCSLGPNHAFRVVCHMSSEAFFLPGQGKFDVIDARPALYICTHLVYNYAKINGSTYEVEAGNFTRDVVNGGIRQMSALKRRFPYLKTLIGVGGPDDETTYYSHMAADPQHRAAFVGSVAQMVRRNRLDGVDWDWRGPGDHGNDTDNFVLVVKELRRQFNQHNLILSLSLPGVVWNTRRGVAPKNLSDHAHFINILTNEYYDHSLEVYPHSALKARDNIDIQHAVAFYLKAGVPPYKINLGISSYGANFILEDANATGNIMGSPTRVSGFSGPYNSLTGFTADNELCKEKEGGGWTEFWDDFSSTPYSRKGDRVVSHDNPRSVSLKIRFAVSAKLGGVSYFGLEKDDFRGTCAASKGKYPMLRSIDRSLVQFSLVPYRQISKLLETKGAQFFWNNMQTRKLT